jgi:beta-lactamase superfamily II metal-dependent hydrolase
LEVQYPKVGTQYEMGEAVITILAPKEIPKDSNANSVAIKLTYGESDFIFTGDADYGSEKDMVVSGIDLDCEVLSVGHHGSASSSSSLFLEKTNPEYVVISCGKGNNYGHPHVEVVELLEAMEIDLFRNDIQGTMIATTDGKDITWSEEPCNDYQDGD